MNSNFKFRSHFKSGPEEPERAYGINLVRDIVGIEETRNILEYKLGTAITAFTARAIIAVGVDLLANAQPRVPYDTGKLRESGRVNFQYGRVAIDVAKGKKDGSIEVDTLRVGTKRMKGITNIQVNVAYSRTNESDKDIALWTHEELAPFDAPSEIHPRALQPGTGPKYLERPWLENYNRYESFLAGELTGTRLEKHFSKIIRKKTIKAGKFTVDYNEIVLDNIMWNGYYGGKI